MSNTDYYKHYEKKKDDFLDRMIDKAKGIHVQAGKTGQVVTKQNYDLDQMNHRLSGMQHRVNKTNTKMQSYLERTSNCKLYLVLGIELFIFILLMSI